MLQNTRSFEKNSFIRFLRFSQIRPLSASEYEQAQTAYERYINYIQLCSDPKILSGIYALYAGKGENTSDRYPVRIHESSFENEIVTLVRHCIDKIRNENGLVESKPSCGHGLRKKSQLRSFRFIWRSYLSPRSYGDSSFDTGTRSRTMSRRFTGFWGYICRKYCVDAQRPDK